jgi:hypothetical protein
MPQTRAQQQAAVEQEAPKATLPRVPSSEDYATDPEMSGGRRAGGRARGAAPRARASLPQSPRVALPGAPTPPPPPQRTCGT